MLKIKDDVKIDDFELFDKFGFSPSYYVDSKVWVKELKKGLFYKEYLIIWWKDKELQIRNNGQIMLDTIYDLIQAGLVEKV